MRNLALPCGLERGRQIDPDRLFHRLDRHDSSPFALLERQINSSQYYIIVISHVPGLGWKNRRKAFETLNPRLEAAARKKEPSDAVQPGEQSLKPRRLDMQPEARLGPREQTA
jgi:hypothetical protein